MKDREPASPHAFELHEAPEWWSVPPAGSIEDGIRLSELLLGNVPDLEAFQRTRTQSPVPIEFTMN